MKSYTVTVTTRLEVVITFSVVARNEKAAQAAAEEITGRDTFGIGSWNLSKETDALANVEANEYDQSHEIDCVEAEEDEDE